MRGRGTIVVVVVLAVAAVGCGDDDGARPAPEEPVARCTPVPRGERTVRVRPKWQVGDRRSAVIQKSVESTEEDERRHAEGTAELTVLDMDRKGTLLRWKAGSVSLPANVFPFSQRELDELHEKLDPLTIQYATDSDGAFSEVGNITALRGQVSAMVDTVERLHPDAPRQVLDALRQLLESEAFLRTGMVDDPSLLHFLYGVEVEQGEPVSGDFDLPNPFGGEPIASTASYELVNARDSRGCATFDVRIDPEPGAFSDALEEGVGRVVPPGDAPDRTDFDKIRLRHRFTMSYDPGSGWIARLDAKKHISFGDRRRTERTLIVTR